jgi:two-component system response regulator DevR
MSRQVRVVVVDDFEIVREGLSGLLSREPDIDVVGLAENAEEGAELIASLEPDVAVIDYMLPGMSGIELCEIVTERHPNVNVVMLTTYLDNEFIRSSIEAGAKAYVYKDVEAKDLKRAVRAVSRGESVLDARIVGQVMRWARRDQAQPGGSLTQREIAVLRLVSRGATNEEIGRTLHLSANTIKTYLSRALRKLGCNTRAEAATVAMKRGLI